VLQVVWLSTVLHSKVERNLQAFLMQDLVQDWAIELQDFPSNLFADASHLQDSTALNLNTVSLFLVSSLTLLLHAWFSCPSPHFLIALFLQCSLITSVGSWMSLCTSCFTLYCFISVFSTNFFSSLLCSLVLWVTVTFLMTTVVLMFNLLQIVLDLRTFFLVTFLILTLQSLFSEPFPHFLTATLLQ